MVLEKTPESPLDCKEIQPVHSEGDQPWDFFGRNDAKAETPVFWPGEFYGLYRVGLQESDRTEQLSPLVIRKKTKYQHNGLPLHTIFWLSLKLMLLNCGVREDSGESLGLQGDPTSPS